jgi:hypothetical protein
LGFCSVTDCYIQEIHPRRLYYYGCLHHRFIEGPHPYLEEGFRQRRTILKNESYAQVFRQVIKIGGIVAPLPFDQIGEVSEKTPLRMCFEPGWLHNEAIGLSEFIYTFPSPLYMRCVQWMLLGNQDEAIISDNSIIDFVIAVIRKFNPLNLSTFGTTTQPTPEAQFQDEFCRACINHTKNCVVSFPEFGNKRGRIDFLIPMKNGELSFCAMAIGLMHMLHDSRQWLMD